MIRDLPRREDICPGIASSERTIAIARGIDSARPRLSADPVSGGELWGPDIGDHASTTCAQVVRGERLPELALHQSVLDGRDRAASTIHEPVPGGNFY